MIFLLKILRKAGLFRFLNIKLGKVYAGQSVKIPIHNGLGFENMILGQDWLDELIRLIPLKDDEAFLDAGVNLGQSLIKLKTAKKSSKYIGFEPNTACFEYVQDLITYNSFTDCLLHQKALFETDTTLELQLDYNYDSRASVIENQRPGMMKNSVTVEGIAFDRHFNDEKIGIIKIDVEGAELEVLKGMQKTLYEQRPVIICEILDSYSDDVHKFTADRAAEVFNLLDALKYKKFKMTFSESNSSITGIEEIEKVQLKLWEEKSLFNNDYVFIPEENTELMHTLLAYISNKNE